MKALKLAPTYLSFLLVILLTNIMQISTVSLRAPNKYNVLPYHSSILLNNIGMIGYSPNQQFLIALKRNNT
jgi:hypothetical protein